MRVTKIVKVNPANPEEALIREAAGVLRSGGLVVIPTETVYGIAADINNRQALERLYEVKQRPKDKLFSVHIDDKNKAEDYARQIPLAAYKLMHKFWPGPLTLILRSATSGSVGVRLPDNLIARKIIALSGVTVGCPSANLTGQPAPVDFSQAIADLRGLVDFAIDSGRTRLQKESSIVDFTVEPFKIVREAAIDKQSIESIIRKKNVLFVCTGNSCRSVMAEALLKKFLQEKGRLDVEVSSCGLMLNDGLSATEATKAVLAKQGIDVSAHLSQKITKELIRRSDLILVMERMHEETVVRLAPEVKNRVFLLREFAKISVEDFNIADPIGRSLEFYEKTVEIIKEAVERVSNLI